MVLFVLRKIFVSAVCFREVKKNVIWTHTLIFKLETLIEFKNIWVLQIILCQDIYLYAVNIHQFAE